MVLADIDLAYLIIRADEYKANQAKWIVDHISYDELLQEIKDRTSLEDAELDAKIHRLQIKLTSQK